MESKLINLIRLTVGISLRQRIKKFMKKTKAQKTQALWFGAILAICVLSVVGVVKAVDYLQGGTYIENATISNYDARVEGSQPQDMRGTLGASGDTNLTNLVLSGDATVGDDLTVSDEVQYGGIEHDWIEGDCTDATTTFVSVANPQSVAVYVDRFNLEIPVGATSSAYITCGTSTTAGSLTSDPTDLLIDDYSMATSTAGSATTTAYIINGDDYAGTGITSPGTNSEDMIRWGSSEYIKCYADNTGLSGSTGGFTDVGNQFDCDYKIHTFR